MLRYKRKLSVLFMLLLVLWGLPVNANNRYHSHIEPEILLAIPDDTVFPFWLRLKTFAQIVSDSIGARLTIHKFSAGEQQQYDYGNSIIRHIKTKGKPDFLISMFWFNGETELLNISRQYQIPLISINSNIAKGMLSETGSPREKYPLWLAHIAPDDVATGKILAEQLMSHYQQKFGKNRSINIFALGGDSLSTPNIDRLRGLNLAIEQNPRANLIQTISTDWTSRDARRKVSQILKKHKSLEISIIWTTSDFIAMGALHALNRNGTLLTQNTLIGGVDWITESFPMIQTERLMASMGGHFTDAGVAVILAYDHLHDIDISSDFGTKIQTPMTTLTKKNIEQIKTKIDFSHWKTLDFKPLSKVHNPNLAYYQLTLRDLIQY